MNIKTKIKQYLDANVHDGEDRKGRHCDRAVFSPDELQELVEEACEYVIEEENGQAKNYAELGIVKGCRADSWRGTLHEDDSINCGSSSILWATKEQAKASIAMAQLSQLMQAANEGWVANWDGENNFIIYFRENKIDTTTSVTNTFLVLKTAEICDDFLNLHRDLIMTARPLL